MINYVMLLSIERSLMSCVKEVPDALSLAVVSNDKQNKLSRNESTMTQ